MPDFLVSNYDPGDPMPNHLISPVIVSSLTGENVASSGSLNAYIIVQNKRQMIPLQQQETQTVFIPQQETQTV